jgi:hypothetical protein
MKDKVILLYEYFFQVITGNPFFEYKPKGRDNRMIDKYLLNMTESYGDEYLFEYFCYQFNRYSDKMTRFGKGVIMLSWIIGDAALLKWKNATPDERFYGDKLKTDFGLKNPLIKTQEPLNLFPNKERERQRFLGTDQGLIHCKQNDLWDPKSKYCMFCKYKKWCEK